MTSAMGPLYWHSVLLNVELRGQRVRIAWEGRVITVSTRWCILVAYLYGQVLKWYRMGVVVNWLYCHLYISAIRRMENLSLIELFFEHLGSCLKRLVFEAIFLAHLRRIKLINDHIALVKNTLLILRSIVSLVGWTIHYKAWLCLMSRRLVQVSRIIEHRL